jgi:hypothetical protein
VLAIKLPHLIFRKGIITISQSQSLPLQVLHSFQSQRRSKGKSSVHTLDIVFQRKIHGAFETNHHYIFFPKTENKVFGYPIVEKFKTLPCEIA